MDEQRDMPCSGRTHDSEAELLNTYYLYLYGALHDLRFQETDNSLWE